MPLAPALRIVLHEGNGTESLDAKWRYATITSLLEGGYRSAPDCPVSPADNLPNREKLQIDISALLGRYDMLRQSSQKANSRFRKERNAERHKCLKLASAGDIPPEVLVSLPSPEEIAPRAGEARAKAQAALADH